jgi:hypothetical protein
VAEVTRTAVIVATAGAAEFSILQHTHAGVRQTADLPVLGIVRRHLHYGTPLDFIGAEHAELDADDGLRFGTMRKMRHTCYVLMFLGAGGRRRVSNLGVRTHFAETI